MKFVIGFLGGIIVGAVGAVAYSVQTGKDLREVADEVRSDLSTRDFDALGARLENRVSEMQKELEARIAQVREKAAAAVDEAGNKADVVVSEAADTTPATVADVQETVAETASEVAPEATDAAGA